MEEINNSNSIKNHENLVKSEFDMDNTHKEKEMYNCEYKRGYDDGIIAAENRCYENGFRDGVQV
jgi:aspartate carbamoyltransferase regulatory subunit